MTKQTASAKLNKLTARAGSDTDLENCIEQEKSKTKNKKPDDSKRARKGKKVREHRRKEFCR